MKVAIVCDWLITLGGAEKVLKDLLFCYPEADVFAVLDFLGKDHRAFLKNKTIHTTFIQRLPWVQKYYRHFLPLMPLAIEQLDLSSYDVIISSSHAVAKGVLTGPDQLHISYVHTPLRYAWDLQHQYLKETHLNHQLTGWVARYLLHRLRLWDLRSAMGVDYFIANSQFIARRILKVYRRPSTVIYPAVDLQKFLPSFEKKEDYYLTVGRLVPYKKVNAIVESFRLMPEKKLIVIGQGPEFAKIRQVAGNNVQLLGFQSDKIMINYMQKAKAFIFAAEEDFGLVPLEAQACGTPVIAYGKGGSRETIRPFPEKNPSGLFFDRQTPHSICAAIKQFETIQEEFTIENCVKQASYFTLEKFQTSFKNFIHEKADIFFKGK